MTKGIMQRRRSQSTVNVTTEQASSKELADSAFFPTDFNMIIAANTAMSSNMPVVSTLTRDQNDSLQTLQDFRVPSSHNEARNETGTSRVEHQNAISPAVAASYL